MTDTQVAELSDKIRDIEARIIRQATKTPIKIAVFDLDNTLIIHDIGEAVFARLKQAELGGPLTIDRKPIPLSWSQYRQLILAGKKKDAYKKMVTAMAGLPLNTLVSITREVLRPGFGPVPIEGQSVPVPRVNPPMQTLIRLLQEWHYQIYIISASNHPSVQITAETLFAIPGFRAFGIRSRIVERSLPGQKEKIRLLTPDLLEPIPVDRGKAALYKKHIGSVPPLVTAGDSELDLPLLNLTHPQGLSIWVGSDPEKYRLIKIRSKNPATFFFLRS